MTDRLSESDWRRINRFASTPMHERTPEMLTPEADDDPDEREDRRLQREGSP